MDGGRSGPAGPSRGITPSLEGRGTTTGTWEVEQRTEQLPRAASGDGRDAGGTTPRMEEVERRREQPPRATAASDIPVSRGTCASCTSPGAVAGARFPVFRVLFALLSLLLLPSCWLSQNKLQTIKAAGELVVLTRVSPTTYYESPEGLAGFAYDLVKAFADHLGVRLRLIAVDKSANILPRLANGEADNAAPGLTGPEGFRRPGTVPP